MKKIHYSIIAGIIIIIAALLFSNMLSNAKKQPKHNAVQITELYVKTEKVSYYNNDIEIHYRGRLISSNNIILSSEVSGKILKGDVNLKAGTNFKKNDILFKIYNEDIIAALIAQKSSFLQILSSTLPDIKIDFPDEYSKWSSFFENFDLQKKLPDLPKYSSNKEKVFLANYGVLSAYYSLAQKEITLSKYTVRAPFDGSFTSVSKEIGDIAGINNEIASMICTSKLEVNVPVFPIDLKWIKKGTSAKIITTRNQETTGIVDRISSSVDENTQSVNTYLKVNNNTAHILQGEYVDVNFLVHQVYGMKVPRESIIDDEYIYILKDNQLVKTNIDIIKKNNDYYIISGLDEDSEAVIESITEVEPNVKYLSRK